MGAQSRPVILLTRPRPAAEGFARALRRAHPQTRLRIMIAPLMAPRPILPAPETLPAWPGGAVAPQNDALTCVSGPPLVVFTSQEGVRGYLRHWPAAGHEAVCVGARTAALARRAGFCARAVAGGTAQALLADLAPKRGPDGGGGIGADRPILVVRGRDTALDLAAALVARGQTAQSVIVYAQEAVPLAPRALTLLAAEEAVILPVFSARSASLLATAAVGASHHAPRYLVAISPAVAQAAAALDPARIAVAPSPDAAGMCAAVTLLMSSLQNTS